MITSPSFSSFCTCWTSASVLRCFGTGWLQLSYVVFLLALRFVSVVVLWFALLAVGHALVLPAVGFALLPAVDFALLGSSHHRSRSSRCPRTLVALVHSSHHMLVGFGSVSDSHHLLLGAVVPSVILSHHWLFWLWFLL